jgi:hypothetical protein
MVSSPDGIILAQRGIGALLMEAKADSRFSRPRAKANYRGHGYIAKAAVRLLLDAGINARTAG